MVPSPESGTASQRRAPHSGHSAFGGTASAPQPPQRIPVSSPSRACSKKRPSVTVCEGSVTAEETHEDGRGVAAEGVGEAAPRALDLPRAGLAAQLGHDLADLRRARGADRVALGLQPARRIHGDLATKARPALFGGEAAGARLEETEPFGGDDLGDGEAVVQLDDVDVLRADARLPVGRRRRALGGRHAREVALVADEHRVRRGRGGEHPDRPAGFPRDLLGDEHEGGAAVGERTAVVELQRIGDHRRLQHRVERDLLAELRLGVQHTVLVVLDGHRRHLRLGGAVLVHVGAGHQREDTGEGEPQRLLPGGVGGVREVLRRVRGRDVQHALGAADEDDVRGAGGDVHHGVTEGRVRRGARRLEARGGHGRNAEHRGGLRAGVELFLRLAAHDVAVVERLHAPGRHLGVGEGVGRRLREQLGRRALVPTELRDADSDDRHSTHPGLRSINRSVVIITNRIASHGAGGPRLRLDRAPPRGGGAPGAPAADLREPRRRPRPEVRARVRRCGRLRQLRAGAARSPRPRRARLHAARSAPRRRAGGPRGRPSRAGRETARAHARGGRSDDRGGGARRPRAHDRREFPVHARLPLGAPRSRRGDARRASRGAPGRAGLAAPRGLAAHAGRGRRRPHRRRHSLRARAAVVGRRGPPGLRPPAAPDPRGHGRRGRRRPPRRVRGRRDRVPRQFSWRSRPFPVSMVLGDRDARDVFRRQPRAVGARAGYRRPPAARLLARHAGPRGDAAGLRRLHDDGTRQRDGRYRGAPRPCRGPRRLPLDRRGVSGNARVLTEEALIFLVALGALGLVVLGTLELVWPSKPRHPVRRSAPRAPASASRGVEAAAERRWRSNRPRHAASAHDSHVRRQAKSAEPLRPVPPFTLVPRARPPQPVEPAPLEPVAARAVAIVDHCFTLYQEHRYADVVTIATGALADDAPAARRPADGKEAAALWSMVALAQQGLGDQAGARAALEAAIATAPETDRVTYQRQLATLALGVAQDLIASAGAHVAPDSESRVSALRDALAWLEGGHAAAPGDAALRELATTAETLLWPAYEQVVMALVQRQEFNAARRLLREALEHERLPSARAETFRELFSGTFAGEIGQLTAQAIRSMQDAHETEALGALERAERLLQTVHDEALPPKRREEVDRRLWWGYNKLGLRRVEGGAFEEALEPLVRALRLAGTAPDRQSETRAALVRAFEGWTEASALAIRQVADAGDREAAIVHSDTLWTRLHAGLEEGLSERELAGAFTRVRRLFEEIGRER